MNKLAAEKIAQEHYALGAQLALEKLASKGKLTKQLAESLASTLGGRIGRAGKRISGKKPGATPRASDSGVLGGAGGNKANIDHAQVAHNLGIGPGKFRPDPQGAFSSLPARRRVISQSKGMMPDRNLRTWTPMEQKSMGFDKKIPKDFPGRVNVSPNDPTLLGLRPLDNQIRHMDLQHARGIPYPGFKRKKLPYS